MKLEHSLTDIIGQFSNANKNSPQESQTAATEFNITSITNLRPFFVQVLQEVIKTNPTQPMTTWKLEKFPE